MPRAKRLARPLASPANVSARFVRKLFANFAQEVAIVSFVRILDKTAAGQTKK